MKIGSLLLLLGGLQLLHAQPAVNPQTFFTGGGCATIPNVGSPILMIANAHKYIEDALNMNNKYTVVKYIHFVQTMSNVTQGHSTYRLAFSITDYSSTKYVGVEAVIAPRGIGSTKINKFLLTNDIEKLKVVIDSTINPDNSYSCGDLKFGYSSYGNGDPNSPNSIYPGRNENGIPSSILNQLNNHISSTPTVKNKTCITANYLETTDFIGTAAPTVPVDLLNCLPDKNAVAAIRIGCAATVVTLIQLVFNNFNNSGTTTSPIVGALVTPANSITQIDLAGVHRIEFNSFTGAATLTINIKTYDSENNKMSDYTCGSVATNPRQLVVLNYDFLGITTIHHNAALIHSFEITQYRVY